MHDVIEPVTPNPLISLVHMCCSSRDGSGVGGERLGPGEKQSQQPDTTGIATQSYDHNATNRS